MDIEQIVKEIKQVVPKSTEVKTISNHLGFSLILSDQENFDHYRGIRVSYIEPKDCQVQVSNLFNRKIIARYSDEGVVMAKTDFLAWIIAYLLDWRKE